MLFLADQDVYKITIEFLRNEGHDVVSIKEVGLEKTSDKNLLKKAREMDRIFITRDKDFGNLVFFEKELSNGVILLRGKSLETELIHKELKTIFKTHKERVEEKFLCCGIAKTQNQKTQITQQTQSTQVTQ